LIFVGVGNPVTLLILAGAVNGIILPLALAVILLASEKKELMKNYRHSIILKIIGWMVVLAMSWMGYYTIKDNLSKLFK
jgi:Mn2+/Fe2+ NRAMP family transporter